MVQPKRHPRKPRLPKAPKTPFTEICKRAPEWADCILATKDDELKEMMVVLELENKVIEDELKKDPDIAIYKERLRSMRETYKEPLKTNRLKMKVIALLLEERGKA